MANPSKFILWTLRFLLTRFMFTSGWVKLSSGDITWRSLDALSFHYFTQPLPHALAWYAHQMPDWFDKVCLIIMFTIELGFPFLIFFGRSLRHLAGIGIILLMLVIIFTGNYGFFNLLVIVLTLLLFDDRFFNSLLSRMKLENINFLSSGSHTLNKTHLIVASFIICLGIYLECRRFIPKFPSIKPLNSVRSWLQPFQIVNGYGLFAVMTTSRYEIEIQGSYDGVLWKSYLFKYKPNSIFDLNWIQPHQPRLDWQMWFAALNRYENLYWYRRLLLCLMEGKPEVLGLFKKNPFPHKPPTYIRSIKKRYVFTDHSSKTRLSNKWVSDDPQLYSPPIFLRNL